MKLSTFVDMCNPILYAYIEKRCQQLQKTSPNQEFADYIDHIRSYAQGGKRIRSYVAYMLYRSAGGKKDDTQIITTVTILEVLHLFLLMQDDVIDKATHRRSVVAFHRHIADISGRDLHYAESQTYLLCDIVNSWVMQFLFDQQVLYDKYSYDRAAACFMETMEEVGIGQMLDLYHMNNLGASYEDIMAKTYLKTATYSFVRPMLFGYYLGGGKSEEDVQLLQTIGNAWGTAFQIRDDLKDVIGYDDHKTPFADLKEGGQTLFTYRIMHHGSPAQQEMLRTLHGSSMETQESHDARNHLVADLHLVDVAKDAIAEQLRIVEDAYAAYRGTLELDDFVADVSTRIGRLGDIVLFAAS